jgi:general secretion pathway protein D
VLKLKHIEVRQAQQFLNSIGGKKPRFFPLSGTQSMIVLGTAKFLAQAKAILSLVDVPPAVALHYSIQNADVVELAKEMTGVFGRRAGGDGSPMGFVAVERLNMLIARNARVALKPEIDRWVLLLDKSSGEHERSTKVYQLQVIQSTNIARVLSQLYTRLYRQTMQRKREGKQSPKTNGKAAKSAGKGAVASTSSKSKSAATGVGELDEEVTILADRDTNTLVVNAPPAVHREITATIAKLDTPRRQVLIESVVVEVTLDEGTDLGIEWAVKEGGSGTVSSAGLITGLDAATTEYPFADAMKGLTYMITSNDKKLALIYAAKKDNRLQVLSSPAILTRDGMPAKISFGTEVPIRKKTTNENGSEDVSFDYRDAKITLEVTPYIDDKNMVTMNVKQVLKQVDEESSTEEAPRFRTREVMTNLQVNDRQTLILGGLISRKDVEVETGVPVISKIPLLGFFFRRTQTVKQGSEILMILTPRVIGVKDGDADALTDEYQRKIIGSMKKENVRELFKLRGTTPGAKEKK